MYQHVVCHLIKLGADDDDDDHDDVEEEDEDSKAKGNFQKLLN